MGKKSKQLHFKAIVNLRKDANVTCTIEFDVLGETETKLLMDDVEDVLYKVLDETIGEDTCPDAVVTDIFIQKGKSWYPVIDEDNKKKISKLKKDKTYKRFLVLPWARYALTNKGALIAALTDSGAFTPEQIESITESIQEDKLDKFVESVNKLRKKIAKT